MNGKNMYTLRILDKVLPEIIETTKIPQLTQMLLKARNREEYSHVYIYFVHLREHLNLHVLSVRG